MPIVYVHGVGTRDPEPSPTVVALMRRYLSQVIAGDDDVHIEYAYWGDVGARFAWDGRSRPETPLLGMGGGADVGVADAAFLAAAEPGTFAGLPHDVPADAAANPLVAAGPATGTVGPTLDLSSLSPDELSDFLAVMVVEDDSDDDRRAELLIAVDEVANDSEVQTALAAATDSEAEWQIIADAIRLRVPDAELAGMGAGDWLRRLGDRVKEAKSRAVGLPGKAASRVVAEFRKPINSAATMFIGDVFAYLHGRGTAQSPGEIPQRWIEAVRAAVEAAPDGEPLVVITHSMGGQITYDAVTHFLPLTADLAHLKVDFWVATASQVGLFEELKLFLESSDDFSAAAGNQVPFPDHLGVWWNVWDHNDFISFTGDAVFEGIDDESYDSGMTLAGAHSGYLQRPSFYRRLADKLEAARSNGWQR